MLVFESVVNRYNIIDLFAFLPAVMDDDHISGSAKITEAKKGPPIRFGKEDGSHMLKY